MFRMAPTMALLAICRMPLAAVAKSIPNGNATASRIALAAAFPSSDSCPPAMLELTRPSVRLASVTVGTIRPPPVAGWSRVRARAGRPNRQAAIRGNLRDTAAAAADGRDVQHGQLDRPVA